MPETAHTRLAGRSNVSLLRVGKSCALGQAGLAGDRRTPKQNTKTVKADKVVHARLTITEK